MKIALLTIATTLLLSLGTVWSQPPGPEQRPGSQKPQMAIGYKAGIKTLPEIPGISLDQRLKLGNALCSYKEKEQSLLMKRYKITGDAPEDVLSAKDAKKVAKIDADLAKQRSKSQNKIRSILTQQQYDVFLEKESQVEYYVAAGTHYEPKLKNAPKDKGKGKDKPAKDKGRGKKGR